MANLKKTKTNNAICFKDVEDLVRFAYDYINEEVHSYDYDNLVSIIVPYEYASEIIKCIITSFPDIILDCCDLPIYEDYDREISIALCKDENVISLFVEPAYSYDDNKYLGFVGDAFVHIDVSPRMYKNVRDNKYSDTDIMTFCFADVADVKDFDNNTEDNAAKGIDEITWEVVISADNDDSENVEDISWDIADSKDCPEECKDLYESNDDNSDDNSIELNNRCFVSATIDKGLYTYTFSGHGDDFFKLMQNTINEMHTIINKK